MCYNLGFWEGGPKLNVCHCLLMLEGKQRSCVLLLHYVFLFWFWQNKPNLRLCLSHVACSAISFYQYNLTDCLFEFWSCFAFLHPSQWNLYHKPHPRSVLHVYARLYLVTLRSLSKSNVNRLDTHSSWACPPTTSSNITETTKTSWWIFKLGSRIIMAGSHVKHRQRGKQTNNGWQSICSHSGPAKTSKASPKIGPQFAR